MSDMLRIRDPRLESTAQKNKRSYPTLQTLAGKTMVVLNNEWTCMNEIAAYLSNALKERFGVAKVINFPVPVGVAADESVIRDAVKQGDFAVVGLAN